MKKYKIYWTMTVNHCGEETNVKNFDVFKVEAKKEEEITDLKNYFENLLEDYLFAELDENINFSICAQTDYYQNIIDFKINKIVELKKENKKQYKINLKTPFFHSGDLGECLKETFNKEYPLLGKIDCLEDFSIERFDGTQSYIIGFSSEEDIEKMYPKGIEEANKILNKYNNEIDFSSKINNIEPFIKKDLNNIFDINGSTCILEGDDIFTDIQKDIIKKFENKNLNIKAIAGLYKNSSKLKEIIGIDNLIIQTTGFNVSGLNSLINTFKSLNYLPKRVFFLLEELHLEKEIEDKIEKYKVFLDTLEVKKI